MNAIVNDLLSRPNKWLRLHDGAARYAYAAKMFEVLLMPRRYVIVIRDNEKGREHLSDYVESKCPQGFYWNLQTHGFKADSLMLTYADLVMASAIVWSEFVKLPTKGDVIRVNPDQKKR